MHPDFIQLKNKVEPDIRQIYDEISDQLKQISNQDLASTLIRLETEKVNIYITGLVAKVRAAAIEELKAGNYPEYLTAGAWTKIIQNVGMPRIRLCSVQQVSNIGHSGSSQSPHPANSIAKNRTRVRKLESRRTAGIGTVGVGGSAIVAALIIPGWEALPITLLCAGGALLICGSVTAITTQREIETIKSRMEKEQAGNPAPSSATSFIKKLTDFQAQNNIKVIHAWLNRIEEAIDNLCRAHNA